MIKNITSESNIPVTNEVFPHIKHLVVCLSVEPRINCSYHQSISEFKTFRDGHNDIGGEVTEALAHTCHKLEYLELSCCTFVSEPLICNVIRSCPKLQYLELIYCNINKKAINQLSPNILVENFVEILAPPAL